MVASCIVQLSSRNPAGSGRWLSQDAEPPLAEPHRLEPDQGQERNAQLPIAMIFYVAAAIPMVWLFSQSQSQSQSVERSDSRRWIAYQGSAVALLMVSGVLGVLTEQGVMRIAWAVLAVATIVRLSVLPGQARRRAASGGSALVALNDPMEPCSRDEPPKRSPSAE